MAIMEKDGIQGIGISEIVEYFDLNETDYYIDGGESVRKKGEGKVLSDVKTVPKAGAWIELEYCKNTLRPFYTKQQTELQINKI